MRVKRAGASIKRRFSIAWLLLVFNLLLIFVPVASFLSLESYERSLLDSLEHALAQQGRFLAAWLSSSPLDAAAAGRAIRSLKGEHTARVRIVDSQGRLLSDSSAAGNATEKTAPALETTKKAEENREIGDKAEGKIGETAPQESWIYSLFSLPVRFARKYFLPPQPGIESADYYGASPDRLAGEEIRAALQGRYGASTRISSGGQVSVTLYSALPIASPDGKSVAGAVLVSQSTFRILLEIYKLRVEVARIFLYGMAAALALTLVISVFVLRPVRRLSRQAREALTPFGMCEKPFSALRRRDEIGELSLALSEFSARLKERLDWAERFSQDASHELKNPIASVRAAAELLDGSDEAERRRIAKTIGEEAFRMERIVEGLRRLSRLDSDQGDAVPVALDGFLGNAALAIGAREGAPRVELRVSPSAIGKRALIDPDRLSIALDTLIDNAISFSPAGGRIGLGLSCAGGFLILSVEDEGPGIPEANKDRIFRRFFSFRPAQEGGAHSGLGLSIALAVAKGAGGTIEAFNREGGGARFVLTLPLAKKP